MRRIGLLLSALLLLFPGKGFATKELTIPSCTRDQMFAGGCGDEPGTLINLYDAISPATCQLGGGTFEVVCKIQMDGSFIPLSGEVGGAMFEFCRRGGQGTDPEVDAFGYITFSAACGNYNWSSLYGGRSEYEVADYLTPTTVGGNSQSIRCTGNGTGYVLGDPSTIVTEGGCFNEGDLVKTNMMADIMLCLDHVRPGGACYLPVLEGEKNTIYVTFGCGAKAVPLGNKPGPSEENGCPVLRYPDDTHLQREIQLFAGKAIIKEGADQDGIYKPLDGRTKMLGTWLFDDSDAQNVHSYDEGEFGASVGLTWFGGAVLIGSSGGHKLGCKPVSSGPEAGSGQCGVLEDLTHTSIHFANWPSQGTVTGVYGSGTEAGNTLCIDNSTAGNKGACTGDPRIACSVDLDCTFTGGLNPRGNLGQCLGMVDMIQYWRNEKDSPGVQLFWETELCDHYHTSCNVATAVVGTVTADNFYADCGGGSRAVSFGYADESGSGPTLGWENEDWSAFVAAGGLTSVVYPIREDVISGGNIYEGGSHGQVNHRGRLANDDQDTSSAGVAKCAPSGGICNSTVMTAKGTPGWTPNYFEKYTLILRPSALTPDQGCTSNCKEGRPIASNDADSVTVTAGTWVTDPQEDDPFIISKESCPVGLGADLAWACDNGASMAVRYTQGSHVRNVGFYGIAGSVLDTSADYAHSQNYFERNRIGDFHGSQCTDANNMVFLENYYYNISADIGCLALNFSGGTRVIRNTFRDIAGGVITIQKGRGALIEGNVFSQIQGESIRLTRGGTATLRDNKVSGLTRPFIHFYPGEEIIKVTVDGLEVYGPSSIASWSLYSKTLITINAFAGSMKDDMVQIYLNDIHWITNQDEVCLAYWDTKLGNDAGGFKITNSSISNPTAATPNAKLFCVANFQTCPGGLCDSLDDLGWWTLEPPPVMHNNLVNDQPQADFIHAGVAAANFYPPDNPLGRNCNNLPAGTTVFITDDTAPDACNQAGGLLLGGGTSLSQCSCDGNGKWWGIRGPPNRCSRVVMGCPDCNVNQASNQTTSGNFIMKIEHDDWDELEDTLGEWAEYGTDLMELEWTRSGATGVKFGVSGCITLNASAADWLTVWAGYKQTGAMGWADKIDATRALNYYHNNLQYSQHCFDDVPVTLDSGGHIGFIRLASLAAATMNTYNALVSVEERNCIP